MYNNIDPEEDILQEAVWAHARDYCCTADEEIYYADRTYQDCRQDPTLGILMRLDYMENIYADVLEGSSLVIDNGKISMQVLPNVIYD